MKFISWNVNGIRACAGKGFMDFFQEADADIFCIQETKMQEGQLELDTAGISSVLELCGEKRLFRDSNFYQSRNQSVVSLRNWNRGARPGRACDHIGV